MDDDVGENLQRLGQRLCQAVEVRARGLLRRGGAERRRQRLELPRELARGPLPRPFLDRVGAQLGEPGFSPGVGVGAVEKAHLDGDQRRRVVGNQQDARAVLELALDGHGRVEAARPLELLRARGAEGLVRHQRRLRLLRRRFR